MDHIEITGCFFWAMIMGDIRVQYGNLSGYLYFTSAHGEANCENQGFTQMKHGQLWIIGYKRER